MGTFRRGVDDDDSDGWTKVWQALIPGWESQVDALLSGGGLSFNDRLLVLFGFFCSSFRSKNPLSHYQLLEVHWMEHLEELWNFCLRLVMEQTSGKTEVKLFGGDGYLWGDIAGDEFYQLSSSIKDFHSPPDLLKHILIGVLYDDVKSLVEEPL